MTRIKDPEALQYMWYVEYDEETHGPPDPTWERDMSTQVDFDPRGRATAMTFYLKDEDDAWVRSDSPVSLTEVR